MTHEVQPAEPAVSEKPKRRWFQFSLRTMLLAITSAGILCGWVANYRCRMASAADHDEKAMWCLISSKFAVRSLVDAEAKANMDRTTARMRRAADEHKRMAEACREAAWRPWVIIREDPSP